MAVLLTGLLVANQEILIPSLGYKLVRDHDDIPGQESYQIRFLSDSKGSQFFSRKFDLKTKTLYDPTVLLRRPVENSPRWEVTGRIDAEEMIYDEQNGAWRIVDGEIVTKGSNAGPKPIEYYQSDLTPTDIPVRQKARYKSLLSFGELAALASQKKKVNDLAQLYSQKHLRITEPIISVVLLLVALPVLVCRDPKAMKSAVMTSFFLTGACMITNFVCKMLAAEMVFDRVMPEFWAWLPVFIFLPIALLELDSMKT